jgi:hypothetical protein
MEGNLIFLSLDKFFLINNASMCGLRFLKTKQAFPLYGGYSSAMLVVDGVAAYR